MADYRKKTSMPVSNKELFAWHERDGAFQHLSPPWNRLTLVRNDSSLRPGSELHFKIRKGPFSILWVARHTEYDPPNEFVDIQVKGPFKKWTHRHRMIPVTSTKSELEDHVTFTTPWGIGEQLASRDLERMFQYRHDILLHDFQVQKAYPTKPMAVAITGASGMVGSALSAFLKTAGHRVVPIVRHPSSSGEIAWDPLGGTIDQNGLEKVDAVVNLAGENIGSGRWTKAKKKRIRESRVKGTRLLVDALNNLKHPPKVLISASGIGYYGNDLKKTCTESDSFGNDFLASVCVDWEAEANRFKTGRCVTPRIGVVLSSSGGALAKMLTPFLLGLGGVIGSGDGKLSWIALDDLVYSLYRLITDDCFSGPVNLCSPNPVSNYEFTKTLGKVLRRPTIVPMPSFAARIAFGEMAEATLLSNCPAIPKILQEKQHTFYYSVLEKALRHTLGR